MTNEAPLPDDVERCLSEMPNVGGFGEEWSGTIRAHIAALEAENKRLKAGQLGAVNTDLEGYQFERAQTGEK